ncbi:TPA: N-acetyltransferase [Candidatus Woesearchaeota archaeon]|nr:N-acetyltransferase [Candidatus Woesearchaeota archaeon]HIH31926.1 N-acetyltransferase [Candidatus Woesearchaeota archaeon]HIH55504.1 N-acetyltransferase [Candidatus Woesearchaeota archaeon]HIJ01061.1 N-acetyltransferase [Candidatus Woesearchaeota archaeon]HIJ14714.1 N-acetyltransferase [Candidatus Woesearchaeota archaeon]
MEINHDQTKHKFYCIVDGKECLVEYSIADDEIDFFHTYVPKELRGQGIAKKIYDHIAEWLKGKNLKIKTSCPYAEKYFISCK